MSTRLSVALMFMILAGCKSGTFDPPLLSQKPQLGEGLVQQQPTQATKGFSFKDVMSFAGFLRPNGNDADFVPPQIVQLTANINTVVSKAAELNTADPPHVTAQKAEAILAALRPWDGLMAAAKSMRLVDDESAAPLQAVVDQLRAQTSNLIQFGAQPETIVAVKHLASQLRAAGNGFVTMFNPAS